MAEALFRSLASQRGIPVEVKSAGVSAFGGQPMAGHAQETLRARGIEGTEAFRSREATRELVEWADLVLTMTSQHKRLLLERFPEAIEKAYVLKEYAGTDAATAERFQEREALVADLQLKLALKQPIPEEAQARLLELEEQLPDVDIPDPIGGSLRLYEKTAADIEAAISAILDRLA